MRTYPETLKKKIEVIPNRPVSVDALLEETYSFLYLIYKYNTSLSPPVFVDLAWHELILHTRFYQQFCEKHFNRFIHHTPGGTQQENRNKYHQTIKLYIIEFGKPNKLIWGEDSENEWKLSQCGTCNS